MPRETVSFVFPRVLTFPETKSRETSALEGKHSLHDRRFMSQAGRTRYFARSAIRGRSARRGEEKNKAPVRSPLFLLFHLCWTVHQVDGHADWSISTTWWWRTWSRWVNKNCGVEFGRSDRKCSRKFSKDRLFKGWTEKMYRSTAKEERRVGFVTNRIW